MENGRVPLFLPAALKTLPLGSFIGHSVCAPSVRRWGLSTSGRPPLTSLDCARSSVFDNPMLYAVGACCNSGPLEPQPVVRLSCS